MIKISSPKDTPKEDILFVIEEPTVSRVKYRYVDIEKEISQLTNEKSIILSRITELKEIKKEMDELLANL